MLILVMAVAACGGGSEPSDVSDPSDTATSAPSTTQPSTTSPSTPSSSPSSSLSPSNQAIVEAAVADLTDHLGVDSSDVTVVSFERVTWNDGSLGCPEPGMAYTQALVDGSRTVLEVDGVTYAYHAGRDDDPFLCDRPGLKPGPDPSLTIPPNDT